MTRIQGISKLTGQVWIALVGAFLAAVAPSSIAGPVGNLSRTAIAFMWTGAYVNIVQPVFVTNIGDAPLNISAIALGGLNPSDFIVGGTCVTPIALAANGGRCRIDIASNLNAGGQAPRGATLSIQSDAPVPIPVVGISAIEDDVIYASFLRPGWIDFSAQPVGTSAPTQTFKFTNIVPSTLNIDAIVFYRGDAGDFTMSTDCGSVASSASCTITVGFVPTAAGPRSTELEIDYTAVGEMLTRVRRYSVTGVGGNAGPITPTTVVEYYNASQDHYFMTWIPNEIAILDAGVQIKGWSRTGYSFNTYSMPAAGTSPVCRFYIPPDKGDSHFYGRGTAECDATAQKNPTFVLEDPDFMNMFLPAAGVCPANTTEVFRVFDARPDANHRYMTDKTVRDQMVAKGWIAEGDGPDLVVMCAPQ